MMTTLPRRPVSRRPFLFRPRLVASLLLALAGVPAPAAADSAAVSPIRILTCNVRIDFPQDAAAGDNWTARQALCRDVIDHQAADIVCLQEARAPHLAFLEPAWSRYARFGLRASRQEGAPMLPGLSIFYDRQRFTPTASGGFWLSETPEVAGSKSWDAAGASYVNWVQLRDARTGREFRVWNTHLDANSKISLARTNQAALVARATAELPPDFPQILAGDFNAPLASAPLGLIREAGWQDTYGAIHGPADPGPTFHAFRGPAFQPNPHSVDGAGKIDFIFFRGPLRATAAEIVRDGQNGHYPSDHYFVSGTVDFVP
jgi:endonuclease/exonuclease/phosphatase family metal-dependent hydrolase